LPATAPALQKILIPEFFRQQHDRSNTDKNPERPPGTQSKRKGRYFEIKWCIESIPEQHNVAYAQLLAVTINSFMKIEPLYLHSSHAYMEITESKLRNLTIKRDSGDELRCADRRLHDPRLVEEHAGSL
jgi:hypothetical protein